MNTLLRRGLLVLGVSTLVGLAFVPLGKSDWAQDVRAERSKQHDDPPPSEREPPALAIRMFAPLVKETLLMGIPAGLVLLFAAGARRFTR